jgi:hypothetical protein
MIMYKSDYHVQYDIRLHEQRIHQYVHRQQLVQMARGQRQRIWLSTMVQLVVALFR